jgi:hypothetical protein
MIRFLPVTDGSCFPNLLFSFYCRRVGVLHLEPIGRGAGAVGRVLPLRHDTFEAELAGVAKHGLAVTVHVLVEADARARFGQDHLKGGFVALQRITPQVFTV